MDRHVACLAKMCRICAQFVFSSKNVSQASKYKAELLAVYQLRIEDDQPNIHPPVICAKCRNVVKRAHVRVQAGKEFHGTLVQPAEFTEHNSTCSVCSRYAEHASSLLPSFTNPESTSSSPSSSSSHPVNVETTTRQLFPESVPDPGPSGRGTKRIWSAKASLGEVRRDYAQKRVKEASSFIETFCKEHKEDKTDLLYFLLTENLRELSDERYKEVVSSWQRKSAAATMAAEDCLAMRICTMLTKGQYKRQYDFLSKKGDKFLAPPHVLDMLEKSFMPGNARFQLEGEGEVVYHTPVKQGEVVQEYGQVSFEPMDQTRDFHSSVELPTPNLRAVAWPYIHAVAKTLEELDVYIASALEENGIHDQDVLIHTLIKDGADGMGDVSVYREASDRLLPDKAFRASFTILRCEVEEEGRRVTLYEPPNPNAVTVARPILEAVADENNAASARELLDGMERDRDLLRKRELRVYITESCRRRHKCYIFNTMIDEKLDRAAGGLQGSGSRFICTLCHATKESARSNLGSFDISRSLEETKDISKYIHTNPDNLTSAELGNIAQGVKSTPILRSQPQQRLIDATHADINMGSFFFKVITCEMARLQTWDVTAEVKELFQDSQKKLNDHLRTHLGSVPSLMMPGNQARLLFDAENVDVILQLIPDAERRRNLAAVMSMFRRLRSVYRATHPEKAAVATYKKTAVEMGQLLLDKFHYVAWPNYLHKLIEHVQAIIEDPEGPGSVGAMSSEGNEAGNKLFRDLRAHFSRQNVTTQSLRDVIWFHWLYTSPKLRRIGEIRARKYTCSKCGQLGHSSLHCSAP